MVDCVHYTLDPGLPASVTGPRVSSPLPQSIRRFGKLPNFVDWRVGDLILYSPIVRRGLSRLIVNAQESGGFLAEDARWTHAAIYIGDHYTLEAVFPFVSYRPIYSRLTNHVIRLRRPLLAYDPSQPDFGYRLAISALTQLNKFYALDKVWSASKLCGAGLWQAPSTNRADLPGLFCSGLYASAYQKISGNLLAYNGAFAPSLALPAHLSETGRMRDVEVNWVKLP